MLVEGPSSESESYLPLFRVIFGFVSFADETSWDFGESSTKLVGKPLIVPEVVRLCIGEIYGR